MRIALLTSTFLPRVGGGEYVVHHLAVQWQRQGHEVRVFNAITDEKPNLNGVRYSVQKYGVPSTFFKLAPHRLPFSLYCARQLNSALAKFQPDFISAHFGYPLGVWLSRIRPVPKFLMTCHGRELTKFPWGYRNIYKIDRVLAQALNKSVGAVAISRQARELLEEIGVDRQKILDIPNGVDLERFRRTVRFDLRCHFNLPAQSKIILSVGREHPQKDYQTGIRAFARLALRHPDLFYVILGRETKRLTSLVAELRLEDRVVLCEGLAGDDLVGAYQQADVLFSPSVWELMPLVVLEGLAAGLPLVVTNVSGSREIVVSSENGFVVEPGQLSEMVDGLDRLLGDDALRKRMKSFNQKKAEKYSWEQISRLYLEHA